MGKRHREDKENDLHKRIKRLERLLEENLRGMLTCKRNRNRSANDNSSEASLESVDHEILSEISLQKNVSTQAKKLTPMQDLSGVASEDLQSSLLDAPGSSHQQEDQVLISSPAIALSNPLVSDLQEQITSQSTEKLPSLDAKVLEILGERLEPDRIFSAAIHEDLVVRFLEVARKGLPTKKTKLLFKKFPLPNNCINLDLPKLNPEIKICLPESVVKRDVRISEKQQIITASLAAIINLMRFEVADSLNGAIRLLTDLQFNESITRRSLILKNLDSSVKEMLLSTVADEWLFGKGLEEKVKAVKTLESSNLVLKSKPHQQANTDSKNTKRPFRHLAKASQFKTTPNGRKTSSYRRRAKSPRRSARDQFNRRQFKRRS
ncbi:hypothetical protein PUN28_003755 [Cardiocondyla obscurior]|uniref:Uncharacterized protein n=1 Tax=Cardiocondyla obscurior TaxID=286306 RepID=A0AAW2GLM0_9HYME